MHQLNNQQASMTDNSNHIVPEKTTLYVAQNVELSGMVDSSCEADERAVVLGSFSGDIAWSGIVQIPSGGMLILKDKLACRELILGGKIISGSSTAVITTNLLRMGPAAQISAGSIHVPPGGLEQARGSIINARLHMNEEDPFERFAEKERESRGNLNLYKGVPF